MYSYMYTSSHVPMYITCTHLQHTTCIPHVYHMYITCISHVHHMYITCTSHVYHMYITCTSHVYHMYITCIPHVYHMYITCTYTHVHNRWMSGTKPIQLRESKEECFLPQTIPASCKTPDTSKPLNKHIEQTKTVYPRINKHFQTTTQTVIYVECITCTCSLICCVGESK